MTQYVRASACLSVGGRMGGFMDETHWPVCVVRFHQQSACVSACSCLLPVCPCPCAFEDLCMNLARLRSLLLPLLLVWRICLSVRSHVSGFMAEPCSPVLFDSSSPSAASLSMCRIVCCLSACDDCPFLSVLSVFVCLVCHCHMCWQAGRHALAGACPGNSSNRNNSNQKTYHVVFSLGSF